MKNMFEKIRIKKRYEFRDEYKNYVNINYIILIDEFINNISTKRSLIVLMGGFKNYE